MENIDQETDITLEHSTTAEKEIQDNVNHFYNNQQEIDLRIAELDEEWDIDKVLQMEGAALSIAGIVLGVTVSKRWLALPLISSIVMIAGIAKGWNRPLPLLRKMGFRTRHEIEKEKYALKAIRGDFKYLLDVPNAVLNAVNK